jgi:crotonobetaine/carnitine-CoA ligase
MMAQSHRPVRSQTLVALVDQRAASAPDEVVVTIDGQPETADGLRQRAVATANQLIALGMKPGERVGIYGATSFEWIGVWLACAYAGLRAVPINVAFRGEFLSHQLEQSNVKLVFTDKDLAGTILDVASSLPALAILVVRGADADVDTSGDLTLINANFLSRGEPTAVSGVMQSREGEPFCVFYTSGTTGPSKGAVVTQEYLLSGAATIADNFEFGSGDCLYGALPLFHFGGSVGLLLSGLVSGAKVALDSSFSVGAFWKRVAEERATVFVGVGPMVNMVFAPNAQRPARDEMPLRLVLAAPVAPDVHGAIEREYACVVRGVYGMTEVFPLCLHPLAGPAPLGSAGRLNPNFELKITDESGHEVPVGTPGEIVARPLRPHVMFEGYEPLDGGIPAERDWFHTGDLGRVDETGSLHFVDRKKDAIRRRGENISSFEVERAYLRHPAVAEVAAHAVPSGVGEDDVKVCVVVAHDVPAPSARELFDFGEQALPRYAVPRYLEFVDALPKTVTGRVRKAELRERLATGVVWDRAADPDTAKVSTDVAGQR